MGNFKEIGSELGRIGRGIGYSLHREDYAEAIGRVATSPFNLMSLLNEKNKPISATHKYELKFSEYNGNRDLKMINHGFWGLVSAATSLRASAINYVFDLQRKGENTNAARFQNRLILAQIEAFYSLNPGETLTMLMPHGLTVDQGVAIIQGTRTADGVKAESHLLAEMNDGQAKTLLDALVGNGEKIVLKEGKEEDPLWLGVKTDEKLFDFDHKPEEFKNYLTGILGKDFWKGKVPTCLDGGSCSSSAGQAAAPELKPAAALGLAGAGGGGAGKETPILPVLSAPALLLAASMPTSALVITQSVPPEVIFATALHSTVAKDNDNSISSVLLESAFLFSVMEQNLERTTHLESAQVAGKSLFTAAAMAEPRLTLDHAIQPVHIITVVSKTEPVSMFPSQSKLEISQIASIIEEKSEKAKPVVESVPMIQFINTKPAANKPLKLAAVKNQFWSAASNQLMVGREVSETEEAWQAKDVVVAEKPVMRVVQAVKELSLPFLEISAETAPVMVLRAALKPVVRADEVDQEEAKLFLVENFFVVHGQVAQKQETKPLRLKKMFWRIKTSESDAAEASILEFELPKDSNQRLYAFYHFLQKVVKKVVGEDVIRQRKVKVIAEAESLDLNLELADEIEYYLQLLRGRKHAQAFAFAD